MSDGTAAARRGRRRAIWCGAALLIAASLVTAAWVWLDRYDPWALAMGSGLVLKYSERDYEESRARADEILAALERWRVANGEYPPLLGDLVPDVLDELRPPLVGRGNWTYRRRSPDRFELEMFVGPDYEADYFDSSVRSWHTDR